MLFKNMFPDNTLVLASNNRGKLAELDQLFAQAGLALDIHPQAQYQIEDAVEDGLSFVENALIKARHAARLSGKPALADDSGLSVPILAGLPGIHSARFGGEHGNDALNNSTLLDKLRPLRGTEPIQAMFVCVLVLVRHADDPLPVICQGIWHGEILEAPCGNNGFGYDPLFWLPELGKSSAALSAVEKNTLSHRGQAMRELLQYLRSDAF